MHLHYLNSYTPIQLQFYFIYENKKLFTFRLQLNFRFIPHKTATTHKSNSFHPVQYLISFNVFKTALSNEIFWIKGCILVERTKSFNGLSLKASRDIQLRCNSSIRVSCIILFQKKKKQNCVSCDTPMTRYLNLFAINLAWLIKRMYRRNYM